MKIRLTIPSWRPYLSGQKVSRIGVVTYFLIEEKCFHQNSNSFYTKHSSTHLLYPYIIFLWHILYFLLHIHSPVIRVIICFERIIVDIIVLPKEKKDVYYFWKKNK